MVGKLRALEIELEALAVNTHLIVGELYREIEDAAKDGTIEGNAKLRRLLSQAERESAKAHVYDEIAGKLRAILGPVVATLEDIRILVMAPGQPLRDVRVADPLLQVGGDATALPQWAVPVGALGVSCIGREFWPGEPPAPDNFVAYGTFHTAENIRGTVIFTASNDEGEDIDLTDEQVEEVTKIVGRLERCPAITTERSKDEFHVVMLEDEPTTPLEKARKAWRTAVIRGVRGEAEEALFEAYVQLRLEGRSGQNPPDQRLCAVCKEPFEKPWHSGPSAAEWPYPYVCSGACATKQGWSK